MRTVTLGIALLVVSIVAWPSISSAAPKPKNQLLANGTVKAVSATSLTVTANGKDTSFDVDAKTRVVGKGMGTKSEKARGKVTIVDLLKAGDRVSVTYQATGATMHASKIEVMAASSTK
jgi:hypothetical protein